MLKQVRFHGRAGEGIVTAAELLAEAAALDGKYSQAFPIFGSEKRGPPVTSDCKISDEPIATYEQIHEPDIVVVANASVIRSVKVWEGLKPGGVLLINTTRKPSELGIPFGFDIYAIDGTSIALKAFGKMITNTVMLGPLVKKTRVVSIDAMRKAIKEHFNPDLAAVNLKVVSDAFAQL